MTYDQPMGAYRVFPFPSNGKAHRKAAEPGLNRLAGKFPFPSNGKAHRKIASRLLSETGTTVSIPFKRERLSQGYMVP